MGLANEAAYLYVQSKKVVALNKDLKKLSEKALEHKKKHTKAAEDKKHKHKKKHDSVVKEMKKKIVKHNKLIQSLHHHLLAFEHALESQHKL